MIDDIGIQRNGTIYTAKLKKLAKRISVKASLFIPKLAQLIPILLIHIFSSAYANELDPPNGDPPQEVSLIVGIRLDGPPERIAISNEGTMIAIGNYSEDGKYQIKIWRTDEGTLVSTLTDLPGIASIGFSSDDKYLFAGALSTEDKTSAIWEIKNGQLISKFDYVYDGWGMHPKKNYVYTLEFGGLELYQLPEMTNIGSIPDVHSPPIFSDDGEFFAARASAKKGGIVGVWRTNDMSKMYEVKSKYRKRGLPVTVAFSKDNKYLATGHYKGIDIWDASNGEYINTIGKKFEKGKSRSEPYPIIQFNESGDYLLAAYLNVFRQPWETSIRIWSVEDGTLSATYSEKKEPNSDWPWFGFYSPNWGVVAQKNKHNSVSMWQLHRMTELFSRKELSFAPISGVFNSRQGS